MQILNAVLAFVYVVAAVAVLYRVATLWLGNEMNPQQLLADAFSALVLFAALGILQAAAAMYVAVSPAMQIPMAVLTFVYVVAAVAVLYRVVTAWLDGAMNPQQLLGNAFGALAVFVALGILHTVAATYGLVPPLK